MNKVARVDLEADLIFVGDAESDVIDPLEGEVRVRGSDRVDEDGSDTLKKQCSNAAKQQCSNAAVPMK